MFLLSLLPALLGGFGSAILLIAEHYGMRRWRLSRTNAYVAGLLALWAGYWIVMFFTGRGISLSEIMIVTTIGGATVKTLYWIDRKRGNGEKDEGQLQESLRELERLSERLEQKDVENRVLRNQMADLKTVYVTVADIAELTDKINTMLDHSSRVAAVGQAGIRLLDKIKAKPGLPDKLRTLAINQARSKNKE
jgi:hypothetical protein